MQLKAFLLLGLSTSFAHGLALAKRAAIETCLANANVPTDKNGTSAWTDDSYPFNGRLPYMPAAIVVPTKVDHIKAAVSCAAKNNLKATAKSGGHSYASLGLGGEDGHVVMMLDRMFNVTLDKLTNVATVQPGARLGHVANELWKQGKRSISAGTCPGVGVSGHALHGGYGMSSHKYGLAVDWIKSMTVVLANASVVTASATQNTDLFWALRGAGSNFGIVAEYQYNTFATPSEVTYFNINFNWNATTAPAKLEALEAYTKNTMPAELTMRMYGSRYSNYLEGMYFGNKAQLADALSPLLKSASLNIASSTNTTWINAFTHYAYTSDTDPTYPYSSQEIFYARSLTLKGLNGTAAKSFADYWYNTGKTNTRNWWFQLDLHGGKNSAMTNGDFSLASYAHRDKLYLIQFYDRNFFGAYPSNGFSFLDNWVTATTQSLPASDWGMYINYADSRLDRATAQQVYWGQNVPRLQSIKATYDPKELFYYPQSIQPASSSSAAAAAGPAAHTAPTAHKGRAPAPEAAPEPEDDDDCEVDYVDVDA